MKIGIDCDGVLTDFEWFIDYFGVKYLKSKKTSHIIANPNAYTFKEKFNCSSRLEINFYKKYLMWYINNMPIRENAAHTIRTLKSEGHTIHIITSRILADKNDIVGFLMRICLKHWLFKHKVNYDSIHFVNMQRSPSEKSKLCSKLNLDLFIEDAPDNIQEIKKYCSVICISARYNSHITGVNRANDFADVYSIITKGQPLNPIINRTTLNVNAGQYFNELYQKIEKLPYDKKAVCKYKFNHKIILNTVGAVLKNVFSIKCTNYNRISDDSAVYVCNHRHSLDIPIAYCLLNKKYARFLIKRNYQFTALGTVLSKLGTIWLGREYPLSRKNSLLIMIQTVLNGDSVLIFPEGTRNRTSAPLLPFRKGALQVAKISNRPIIPIVMYRTSNFEYRIEVCEKFKVSVFDDIDDKNVTVKRSGV